MTIELISKILIAALFYALGKYLEIKGRPFIILYVASILTIVGTLMTSTIGPGPHVSPTPTPESEKLIPTAYSGIMAPASDFLFPESSQEYLTQEILNQVMESPDKYAMRSHSQRAINEIFARYGFIFGGKTDTSREAISRYSGKDWYEQCKKIFNQNPYSQEELLEVKFNKYERANVYLIWDWQNEHNLPPLDA